MIEIETKIIDFDEAALKANLKAANAEFKGKVLQRRWVFDIVPHYNGGEFVRVRTDGTFSSITYKKRLKESNDYANTEEIEIRVDDFEKAKEIISRILGVSYYQENWRETYMLSGVEITINKWPKIPPVLEVEASTKEEVDATIKKLKINGKNLGNISITEVYKRNGIDIHGFKELRVSD